MTSRLILACWTLSLLLQTTPCASQLNQARTTPPEGIRQHTPAVHALTNARIVQAPGRIIPSGTIVIRDGLIESIGEVHPPKDARVWDMKGMTIYPGITAPGM